jgi:acetyl esterase/lipase
MLVHTITIHKIMLYFQTRAYQLGLLAASLLGLQGCTMQLLDWATPTSGYQLQADITYGNLPRQILDIYTPTTATQKPITIVFFYGGAWESGDKHQYRFVAQALAEEGYRVIVPDYRVYPEVLFPGFMSDAALAVKWAATNTDQPLVLMGHSAGAHMAALLALNKNYLGADQQRIAGLIGLSGPYDFLPLKSERLKIIFNGADNIADTQPINFVTDQAPPTLLLHGLDDTRVKPFNSEHLATALTENDIKVTIKLYPDASHGITVGALAKPLRGQLPVLTDIRDFLRSIEKNKMP